MQALPIYYSVRVLDNDFGTVITDNLPHTHQIAVSSKGFQPGGPAQNMVGDFKIPLYPPSDRENYHRYLDIYSKLAYGQRVEIYPVLDAPGTITNADSRGEMFTGVILDITKNFSSFVISGKDSLWIAQNNIGFQGERPNGTCHDVFTNFLGSNDIIWDDDFSSGSLANYTIGETGTWTTEPSGALGLPDAKNFVLHGTGPLSSTLITNTSFPSSWFQAAVEASATFYVLGNGNLTLSAEVGVILGATDSNNWVEGRTVLGNFSLTAEILQKSGGSYTSRAQVSNIFTGIPAGPFIPIEVKLVAYYPDWPQTGNLKYVVIINGHDSGCVWDTGSNAAPAGKVGLRAGAGADGTFDSTMRCLRFTVQARNISGSDGTGNNPSPRRWESSNTLPSGLNVPTSNTLVVNGQSLLDIWGQMADASGAIIQKRPNSMERGIAPVSGADGDVIEWLNASNLTVSTDVHFIEGQNLLDMEITSNAENYGRDVRVAGSASIAGSDGTYTWHRVLSLRRVALTDTVVNSRTQDLVALILFSKAVSDAKNNAGVASVLTTLRTAETAGRFYPGDVILVTAPSLQIFETAYRVLQVDYTEGTPIVTITVSQYPGQSMEFDSSRQRSSHEIVAGSYQKRN